MTVRRSGRVWSNTSFKPWGSSEAATVTSRAWLPVRRRASAHPREASQPAATKTRRTFSSAPHVSARAIASGAGAVLRAIDRATATSALAGRTVIGKLGPRLRRAADNLVVLNMTQRSGKKRYGSQRMTDWERSFLLSKIRLLKVGQCLAWRECLSLSITGALSIRATGLTIAPRRECLVAYIS
jgi:hypothetical protein